MTTQEVYKRFLLEINKNDSNEGTNVLPSHFVLMFNTESVRWLAEKLRDNADNQKLDDIGELLSMDVRLTKVRDQKGSVDFQLPKDFYRYASGFLIADSGFCKGEKVYLFEKKPLGLVATLNDEFSTPQFDYRETPFIIGDNKVKVFVEGFQIKNIYTTFYRKPKPLDMIGYVKIDGSPSENQDTDLSDESIDQVISRLVVRISGQYQDGERWQSAQQRIVTEP